MGTYGIIKKYKIFYIYLYILLWDASTGSTPDAEHTELWQLSHEVRRAGRVAMTCPWTVDQQQNSHYYMIFND